ncbi:prepilin-type N-terminal cleavage/methylation domain-containing protein [Candidatus Parcubacteria bacterium]|nr:prepilin-type N-terminal cleavage/methylation domain-containing protein [Candidatus Parcubacteria bacterium]
MIRKNCQKGYSLVEMLIYIAILVVLLVAIVNTLIVITASHRTLKVSANIQAAAVSAMDRITREVREAKSIASGDFGVDYAQPPNAAKKIVLNTTDSTGAARTVQFHLDGTNSDVLDINDNGTDGPLTTSNVKVFTLIFSQITVAGVSTAIKIEMGLQASQGTVLEQQKFYSTVVLRGSYQ